MSALQANSRDRIGVIPEPMSDFLDFTIRVTSAHIYGMCFFAAVAKGRGRAAKGCKRYTKDLNTLVRFYQLEQHKAVAEVSK